MPLQISSPWFSCSSSPGTTTRYGHVHHMVVVVAVVAIVKRAGKTSSHGQIDRMELLVDGGQSFEFGSDCFGGRRRRWFATVGPRVFARRCQSVTITTGRVVAAATIVVGARVFGRRLQGEPRVSSPQGWIHASRTSHGQRVQLMLRASSEGRVHRFFGRRR